MKKILLAFFAIVLLSFSVFTTQAEPVFSGEGLKPSTTLEAQVTAAGIQTGLTAKQAIVKWTNFAISFVAVIAIFFIVLGGFYYLTSGANEANQEKGKKMIIGAVAGIIIIMSAYAIVNTLLGTETGTTTVSPANITPAPAQTVPAPNPTVGA